MNPKICPTCQAPVPPHAPGGFCPACLLRDAEEPSANGHAAPPLEEIAAAFPHLEIVRLIGQGGMGSVYQARQPDLDRSVALKILAPELGRDPAFAERFAREARALGKLNHPNIVTVFEHGESGGFFYLLMEYVDGVNLRQAMRAGRFTPEQALAIVPGICDALQAAHAQGIWHRDIKPENILLDARGDVKIADFGIARMVGDPQRNFTLTMTGGALGSAAYMAPEQHETPRDVDHRADIYSLGVVIYEMLTGELPLGRFPAPSQRAAVDARIDEIVFKTLEKERELRQQSATEVKTDVRGAAQPQPTGGVAGSTKQADTLRGAAHSGIFPNFRLSLGLWIGGLAAVLAGLFTSPLVSGLGLVAAALGLIGCCWILREIRQDEHPEEHRMPLLVLVFWPVILGLTWLASASWFSICKRDIAIDNYGVTHALYGFAFISIAAPLIIGRILWNLFGKESVEMVPNRFEKMQAVAAVLLISCSTVLVKWVVEREDSYGSYRSKFIQFTHDINWPEDAHLVRLAVEKAVPAHLTKYRKQLLGPEDSERAAYNLRVESPYLVLETSLSNDRRFDLFHAHFKAIEQRLKASLPKRIGVNASAGGASGPGDSDAPLEIQRGYRAVRPWNILLLVTPILVVILSVASRRPVPWILTILSFCIAVGVVNSPQFKRPSALPPSMDGMAPLPPLPMPEYDFSTTRDAMESLIKAAKKSDVDAFKRGISSKLLEVTLAGASDFSEPMRDIAGLTYAGQISQEGDVASVNMVNQTTKLKTVMPLVRQDGDWKLALPDSHDPHKVEPPSSAPSTIEERLEVMEEHRNSIKPTPVEYRAACRVEVHLKRGDTEVLLNEALGKFCTVLPVPDVKDQFDLVVTDPDPAQTSRLANYIGQHAEELLKEREIQGTVKILKPAERPEKPWIAEEPSAVNDGNKDQAKYPKARKVDEDNDWAPWAEYLKDGDRRVAIDDRAGALKSYRDGLAYVEKIQVNNPDALLSVQAMCLARIGDVLKAQGDFAKAVENYRSSQAIVKKLLMRTPENAEVRDELTRIHVKIGDTQTATGDQLGAAKSYRDAVAVAEKLERNWETEYPNGSRGDDLARDYQAEETLRLIDKPDRDSWDLMWMIGQAGAIKDGRLRPLLERKDLLKDENLALALAGYDFSLNGNQKRLDFILAKLAEQRIGADVNEVIVLSFLDEWDRSTKAVDSHFLATDGAGGDCMNSFWGRRMLLFPRRYLEFKGKVTALPPEK